MPVASIGKELMSCQERLHCMEVILLYWFASLISWMAHKFNVGRFIWRCYLSLIGDPDHILAVRAALNSSYEWCVQSAINTWSCVAACVGIKLLLVCIANGSPKKKWQTAVFIVVVATVQLIKSPYVIFLCIARKRCNPWNSTVRMCGQYAVLWTSTLPVCHSFPNTISC